MKIPAIIIIVMFVADWLYVSNQHGKSRGVHNIYAKLIADGILLILLFWAGVFF